MEDRIYQGNIEPDALANYLVSTFGQYQDLVAQKLGQGNNLLVQIGRVRGWSGNVRGAIGVSISRVPGGIRVTTGQSSWLDLSDGNIAALAIGALFFPPLIIFPLMRGIRGYELYQDIWDTIDEYCTQNSAVPGAATTTHALYCRNCGAVNDESAQQCYLCGTPLHTTQTDQPPLYTPPQEHAPATPYYVPSTVTCPKCGAVVPRTKYCGNCGSELPQPSQSSKPAP